MTHSDTAAALPSGILLLGTCDILNHPDAPDILEGDEFDMAWHLAEVPLVDLGKYNGYLDPSKREALMQVATPDAMTALLKANPPLFFYSVERGWYLLDGQHRLTRARELGLVRAPVAVAHSGVTD